MQNSPDLHSFLQSEYKIRENIKKKAITTDALRSANIDNFQSPFPHLWQFLSSAVNSMDPDKAQHIVGPDQDPNFRHSWYF